MKIQAVCVFERGNEGGTVVASRSGKIGTSDKYGD